MKSIIIIFMLMLLSITATAQLQNATAALMGNGNSSIPMGVGATFINGETYYLVNIAPELAFGKLGLGLDLNLRFNTRGTIAAG